MNKKYILTISILSFSISGLIFLNIYPSLKYTILITSFFLFQLLIIKYLDIGIYLFIISIFTLFFLTSHQEILPSYFNWLYDFLIIAIFLSSIVNKNNKYDFQVFDYIAFLFFSILIIREIFTETNLISIIFGIRDNFRLILIFFVFRFYKFKNYQYKWMINLIIFLTLLQIPTVLLQKFKILPVKYYGWDYFCGTLGKKQAAPGMIMILILNIIFFSNYLKYRKLKYLIIIMLLSIFPIIASAQAYFLFLPLAFILLSVFRNKANIISLIPKTLIITIMLILSNQIFLISYNQSPFETIYDKYINYTQNFSIKRQGDLRRPEAIAYAISNIFINKKIFWGYGISGFRKGFFGSESNTSAKNIFHKLETLQINDDFPLFILKIGIIGTFLFYLSLFSLIQYNYNYIYISNKLFLSSYAINVMILIIILSTFYTKSITSTNAGAIFWIILGIYLNKSDN